MNDKVELANAGFGNENVKMTLFVREDMQK
jgi:hypothetical protein